MSDDTKTADKSADVMAQVPVSDEFYLTVKRANETLGVKPLNGKITLLSRRLFHLLVYFIQEDGNREIYRRSLQDFIKNMNYPANTTLIKKTLHSLMGINVHWNTTLADRYSGDTWNSETTSSLVAEVSLVEKGRGHEIFVEWSFAPKLREKLLQPKFYTRFSHAYFNLRSSHSVALFEIVERYKTNPSRCTCKEPWEWWVPILTGNSNDKILYKYFKRDVIRPAIDEINALVKEYQIELVELRDGGGRKVTAVQFAIHHVEQQPKVVEAPNPINLEVVNQMLALGITEADANKYFSNHSEDVLRRTVEMTERRGRNQKLTAVTSLAAYFKVALKNGYASQGLPQISQIKLPEVVVKPEANEHQTAALVKKNKATEYFDALGDESKNGFISNYFDANKNSVIESGYKRSGFKSSVFREAFYEWLGSHLWGTDDEYEAE